MTRTTPLLSRLRSWLFAGSLLCVAVAASGGALGCDEDDSSEVDTVQANPGPDLADLQGEPATPPFDVSGDADDLLLVWYDEEGPHTAQGRDAIPESRRAEVRVDSLRIAPEDRLDPEYVYIADLREFEGDHYAVVKLPREAFEARIDRTTGVTAREAARVSAHAHASAGGDADADVIIYGAEWCGACRSAASFFREHGVPFVEKDLEQDPAALAEMQEKARRAGVRPSGIPIIDFRGTIVTGFDRARLEQLIAAGPPGPAPQVLAPGPNTI